jgi:hypothetical protein
MQSCLFIGGSWDGLNIPVADDRDFIQLTKGAADKATYFRETLSLADASVVVYRHDSLTPEQALEHIIVHYHAWAVNPPRRSPVNHSGKAGSRQ